MTTANIYRRWKSQPFFVSSTFRDMHAERDHLHRVVFPALEEWLRKHRILLEPIDLRWGVETSGETEAETKEQLVLKVCLDGINECQPFLIILLGDRYGWQPPAERLAITAGEYGFERDDVAGMSVTALEIEAGLLASDDQAVRSFVYLRQPLPYELMPTELRAVFSDNEAGNEDAADRLSELKARLRADPRLDGRVCDYALGWDSSTHAPDPGSLSAWGEQVLADLKAELSTDVEVNSANETHKPSWQEEEAFELEAFVEQRSRVFVGRGETIGEIETWAFSREEDEAPLGLVYTGASGAGKSALIAELYRRWKIESQGREHEAAPLVLAHAAGISPRAGWITAMLRRWIDELAPLVGIEDTVSEGDDHEKVVGVFRDLVATVSRKRRVILLIDAINQFDKVAWHDQSWIPAGQTNIRLLATAIPGEASQRLLDANEAIQACKLPTLTAVEVEDIAIAQCARFRKTLADDVLATLREHPAAGNALWLRMAIDELLLLDADDFELARQEYADLPGDRQIPAFMEALVRETFPNDIPGMYAYLLSRLETRFGTEPVRAFALALALSRSGWRDLDLRELAPRLGAGEWNDTTGAILRRAFRLHLSRHGDPACWDFFHSLIREAVIERYAASNNERRLYHAALADYLSALPGDDPMAQGERMHHLLEAGDTIAAAKFVAHASDGRAREAVASSIAQRLSARQVREGLNADLPLIEDLLEQSNIDELELPFRLMVDVSERVLHNSSSGIPRALIKRVNRWYSEKRPEQPTERYDRDLAISHDKLGDLERATGNVTAARLHYEAGIRLWADLYGRIGSASMARNFALSHNRLGSLERLAGHEDAARAHYESSLAIIRGLQVRIDSADMTRNLALCHDLLGDLERSAGNVETARAHYETGMGLWNELDARLGSSRAARDLAISYSKLGALAQATGALKKAHKHYKASMTIAQSLHLRIGNLQTAHDLAFCGYHLGNLNQSAGKLETARSYYNASLAIAEDERSYINNDNMTTVLTSIHDELGRLEQSEGSLKAARKHYAISMEIREELHRQRDNTQTAQHLAVSHSRLGDLERAAGSLEAARSHYNASAELQKTLHRRIGNVDTAVGLVISAGKLGDLDLLAGNVEGARSHYESSMKIIQRLHGRLGNATTGNHLVDCHIRLGNMEKSAENFKKAHCHYQAAMEITQKLHEQIGGVGTARKLASCHDHLGDLERSAGNVKEARTHYNALMSAALALQGRIGNLEAAIFLAETHNKLGDLAMTEGAPETARPHYEASLDIARGVHESIGNSDTAAQLARSHERLGDLESLTGHTSAARSHHRASMEIARKLHAQIGNAQTAQSLAVTHNRLGELAQASGEMTAARRHYEASMEIAQDLHSRVDNVETARGVAVVQGLLGDLERALGNAHAARRFYKAATQIAQNLHERIGDAETAKHLCAFLTKFGQAEEKAGAFEVAYSQYLAFMDVARDLLVIDSDSCQSACRLAYSQTLTGNLYLQRNQPGDPDRALKYLVEAIKTLEQSAKEGSSSLELLRQLLVGYWNVIMCASQANNGDLMRSSVIRAHWLSNKLKHFNLPPDDICHQILTKVNQMLPTNQSQ